MTRTPHLKWLSVPLVASSNSPYAPYGEICPIEGHPHCFWNIGVHVRNKDAIGAGLMFDVEKVPQLNFLCLGILRQIVGTNTSWKVLGLHGM